MYLGKVPTGLLTFQRCLLKEFPDWHKSQKSFTKIHISSDGTIDENGKGMLQASVINLV